MRWTDKNVSGRLRALGLCALFVLTLTACVRADARNTGAQRPEETAAELPGGVYEESLAVSGVNEKASPYYGIMYVSVMDVNGNEGDSKTVYSFKDKSDPDNAWSVMGLEIGYIETEIVPGADVAILFHGDVIRDGENLEFIAVLPDGSYTLKKTTGVTLNNTMSGFTVKTADGGTVSLVKDNCRIEEEALSRDSGDRIVVYYADGGALGNYPLCVYKIPG